MSSGVPMNNEDTRILREAIERGNPELVRAIREGQRETREMWSHMTSVEIANWILGIEEGVEETPS